MLEVFPNEVLIHQYRDFFVSLQPKMKGHIMKRNRGFSVITMLAILTINSLAWAHSPNDATANSFQTKVREASLIMYGQVINIQYRNSEPTKEQPKGLPHTFVTYQVEKVLRGEAPDKQITLRIPGGADGEGGVYMSTNSPAFARGQTDVLFIKGGEIESCQLVECVEGRFRVDNNQVFNAWGVPVVEAHETLRIGGKPRFDLNVIEMPRPSFESLMKRQDMRAFLQRLSKESGQSVERLRARYDREAPKFTTVTLGNQTEPIKKDLAKESEASPMEKYGAPLSPEIFFDAIQSWSNQVGDPQSRVIQANVKERFEAPDEKLLPVETKDQTKSTMSNEERYDIHAKEGLR